MLVELARGFGTNANLKSLIISTVKEESSVSQFGWRKLLNSVMRPDSVIEKLDILGCDYINDDGFMVEPKWYCPIIPMVLVNGMVGIGTGFSTKIPQYNPLDCVTNIKRKLNNEPYQAMIPYYNGFKGKIIKIDQIK